jgi:preprotein translocase subunit Sss1
MGRADNEQAAFLFDRERSIDSVRSPAIEPRMQRRFVMAKAICKVLGVVFLIIGLVGFIIPNLLGMHLSGIHNIIHLISAALALYFGFAASPSAARAFSLIFGAIYLLLGALGFIAPGPVIELIHARHAAGGLRSLAADNIVHLLLGAIFIIAGLAGAPHVAPITTHGRTTGGPATRA